jgi:hypothetical protein
MRSSVSCTYRAKPVAAPGLRSAAVNTEAAENNTNKPALKPKVALFRMCEPPICAALWPELLVKGNARRLISVIERISMDKRNKIQLLLRCIV